MGRVLEVDVFKACGTCGHLVESRVSHISSPLFTCKIHKDYPIQYYNCKMSIVCDDYKTEDSDLVDNISNFRRVR